MNLYRRRALRLGATTRARILVRARKLLEEALQRIEDATQPHNLSSEMARRVDTLVDVLATLDAFLPSGRAAPASGSAMSPSVSQADANLIPRRWTSKEPHRATR
jgi:hypothetical protein